MPKNIYKILTLILSLLFLFVSISFADEIGEPPPPLISACATPPATAIKFISATCTQYSKNWFQRHTTYVCEYRDPKATTEPFNKTYVSTEVAAVNSCPPQGNFGVVTEVTGHPYFLTSDPNAPGSFVKIDFSVGLYVPAGISPVLANDDSVTFDTFNDSSIKISNGFSGVLNTYSVGPLTANGLAGYVTIISGKVTASTNGGAPVRVSFFNDPLGWLEGQLRNSQMVLLVNSVTHSPTIYVTDDKAYVSTMNQPQPLTVLQGYKVTMDQNGSLTQPAPFTRAEINQFSSPIASPVTLPPAKKTISDFNATSQRLYTDLTDEQNNNYGNIEINFSKNSLYNVGGNPMINFEALLDDEVNQLIPIDSPLRHVPSNLQQLTDYVFGFQVMSNINQDILRHNLPIKLQFNSISDSDTSRWQSAKLYQYYCISRHLISGGCYQFAWIPISATATILNQQASIDAVTKDPRLGLFAIFGSK
ncbi:MAG: hypothetical protein HY226_04925 [Candidatus Vogelbacteria bacterium]|nr:hypothetical protein [Candidatus Vogelbacteria bacterium]